MIPTAPTRIDLLDAALTCFAARGFEATTMGEIADAAGVPLATAFLHYPSKHAFALAMYQGLVADLQARLADLPRGSVAERFAALMILKLDGLDAHREAMRALLAAAVDSKGPVGVLSDSTAVIRARMSGAVQDARSRRPATLTLVIAAIVGDDAGRPYPSFGPDEPRAPSRTAVRGPRALVSGRSRVYEPRGTDLCGHLWMDT